MSRIKNVIEKAESMKWKINPLYDITGIQLMEIYENSRDIYSALSNAFVVGYLQGTKAAKAEIRLGKGKLNG